MGAEDLALTVKDANACNGCTIGLDNSISAATTMTRKGFPTTKMWDPSDDPNDVTGSQVVNRITHGGLTKVFLLPSIPFALNLLANVGNPPFPFPMATGNITHMSVYHPFPLRIDGHQYDACFQIGEFGSTVIKGTGVVVLIPLASVLNITGHGANFVDTFAGLMTGTATRNVDVASLKIADILDASRPFYTWQNRDGARVIVMSEPVTISASNMASIKMSAPTTPPADVIHEIHQAQYKAVAPPPRPPVRIVQPPVDLTVGETHHDKIVEVLKRVGYAVAVFFVVWLAIRFAKSDAGANVMKSIGGGLSWMYRSLTGASARAAQGVRSGVGAVGTAASSAAQGVRAGVGAIGVGPKPLRPTALPTSAELIAKRAQKEKELADNDARKKRELRQYRTRRNGTFPTANPLLAKKPPTDQPRPTAKQQEAAAGVGFLKPAPTKVTPPAALKVAKKQVGDDFSQENPMQRALRNKKATVPPPKVPKRRNIGPIEEETAEDRIERRARETALPPFAPNLRTQYLRNTGAVAGGRRRRRMRTGRRV